MKITVRYFASLREQIGHSDEELDVKAGCCVGDLRKQLSSPDWPSETLCAVNYQYASDETIVHAGDEVAFFPPVTGG